MLTREMGSNDQSLLQGADGNDACNAHTNEGRKMNLIWYNSFEKAVSAYRKDNTDVPHAAVIVLLSDGTFNIYTEPNFGDGYFSEALFLAVNREQLNKILSAGLQSCGLISYVERDSTS